MPILADYISRRLKDIQKKHNFNPHIGVKQIAKREDLKEPYYRFRELVDLIQKLNLSVPIPCDPIGFCPGKSVAAQKPQKLYLFRKYDGSYPTDIYKLGYSTNTHKRLEQVQGGNDGTLHVVLDIPGGRKLERYLKIRLREYKTRDVKSIQKGEFFRLPPAVMRPLLKELKAL
jgi:hypothetical protein